MGRRKERERETWATRCIVLAIALNSSCVLSFFQEYIFSIVFCKTESHRDVSKRRRDSFLLRLNYNLTHHATSSLLLLLGIPIAGSIGSVLPQTLRSALSDPHDRS